MAHQHKARMREYWSYFLFIYGEKYAKYIIKKKKKKERKKNKKQKWNGKLTRTHFIPDFVS